jgi:cytochrome c553
MEQELLEMLVKLKQIVTYSLGLLLYSLSYSGAVIADDEVARALELTPNLENGRRLYESCAICHSPQGWGTPDGRYPEIAGQHLNVIIKQLADIRSGNRDNPTMYPFASASSLGGVQGLVDVSAYIAQLPMSPINSHGPGFDLELGRRIYAAECAECHGDNGEGDNAEFYPSLYGQHYEYMLRQMIWIATGKRRNADETMVKQLRNMNMRDLRAVIDYASRLRPPTEKLADSPDWWNPDFRRNFVSVPHLPVRPRPMSREQFMEELERDFPPRPPRMPFYGPMHGMPGMDAWPPSMQGPSME